MILYHTKNRKMLNMRSCRMISIKKTSWILVVNVQYSSNRINNLFEHSWKTWNEKNSPYQGGAFITWTGWYSTNTRTYLFDKGSDVHQYVNDFFLKENSDICICIYMYMYESFGKHDVAFFTPMKHQKSNVWKISDTENPS